MFKRSSNLRVKLAALAATLALASGAAQATNHALIIWIGDYPPPYKLDGIQLDARMARQMATAMGVPSANIHELSNAAVTRQGVARALSDLNRTIAQDDKVFIYYSGHGSQIPGVNGAKCTEALAVSDGLYPDFELQDAIASIANKASQVVMMNDSCFSGGAATKAMGAPSADQVKYKPMASKAVPGRSTRSGSVDDASYECGEPVNMSRSMDKAMKATRPPKLLYIAAAAANEASIATQRGSLATLAWQACMSSAADANHSGSIDGEELRACSQRLIDSTHKQQTITLVGDVHLPLFFTPASVASDTTPSASAESVSLMHVLQDIRATADPSFGVHLSASSPSLRIGQDQIGFSVALARGGYLYVLQVGSDGKTVNVLFPNKTDTDNKVGAGTYNLPRPSWRVRSAGPAGTSYLMAVVTTAPVNISKGMNVSGTFASGSASLVGSRNLVSEATGANGGSGRIGASEIVAVREVD